MYLSYVDVAASVHQPPDEAHRAGEQRDQDLIATASFKATLPGNNERIDLENEFVLLPAEGVVKA